jgi:serine phosphatase RsbU (regulator of sigma subunit)
VGRRVRVTLLLAVVAAALFGLARLDLPYLSFFAKLTLGAGAVVLLPWLVWKAYNAFLYKVGRRLAFSYFLVGVLPIPMIALLTAVVAYLASGFFLGHLFRDAAAELQADLRTRSRVQAAAFADTGRVPSADPGDVVFGYYRSGRRVGGDPRTPAAWPVWLDAADPMAERRERGDRETGASFVTGASGEPTFAAAATVRGYGALAFFVGDLGRELSTSSGLWIKCYRSDDPELDLISLEISGRKVPLGRMRPESQAGEAEKFFKELSKGERFWDEPLLWWGEIAGPLLDRDSGQVVADYVAANLNATPRTVLRHLFASAAEIDALAWVTLVVICFLLFDVYMVAAVMSIVMIVGLSRAVNRMSRATLAVQRGDFSVRIPVRRRDQVGDLQRSFNDMAANLEALVASQAQKELLEKELALARSLQKSLIPEDFPGSDSVELATLFEPSAAIGGDYFDVLKVSEHEIAVFIADVSGHGLPSGLRMAMLKAALQILIEETREPAEILRRLDAVVRSDRKARVFVTATLGILNLASGRLTLTNAGHPPTYVIRQGKVDEILLPGAALGGLGDSYGAACVTIGRGDVVVWLSDGLIEAANAKGEPFGYDRIVEALGAETTGTANEVKNRLLRAIEGHCGPTPPEDDRTLVVLRYGWS